MERLMFEVPNAGHDHGDFMIVGYLDHILISDGPAGLDDRRHSRLGGQLDIVGLRQERIGDQDRALGVFAGLLNGNPDTLDTAGLPAPDPDGLLPLTRMIALDLTYLITFQPKAMASICALVGFFFVTDFHWAGSRLASSFS